MCVQYTPIQKIGVEQDKSAVKNAVGAISDSLWFTHSFHTLLAAAPVIGPVQMEQAIDTTKLQENWLIDVSLDGARDILSTVAGSMIMVTGGGIFNHNRGAPAFRQPVHYENPAKLYGGSSNQMVLGCSLQPLPARYSCCGWCV